MIKESTSDKKGKWTLSPAYDLTYSYKPNNHWIKQHQMSINGKRIDIKYEDLETIANKYKIGNYKEIIEEVKEGVSQWNKIAKEAGIAKEVILFIDKNLEYNSLNNNRNFKPRG
jgi:serine/threonine-protein kinase HipA